MTSIKYILQRYVQEDGLIRTPSPTKFTVYPRIWKYKQISQAKNEQNKNK